MFYHIFKYRLKVLLRSKEMIFWTLLFPIALSIFFNLAFSGLRNQDSFNIINIAFVDNANDPNFSEAINSVSEGEDRIFNMIRTDLENAEKLLENDEISGIIVSDENITLTVNSSGINQSIIKSFIDQYKQVTSTATRILSQNPQAAADLPAEIATRISYTKSDPMGKSELDIVLNYFYALIAMTCFYGGFFGVEEINQIQANLSKRAARVNVAPIHKLKSFIYSLSASALIQLIEITVFLTFLIFVLGVKFGENMGLVILTTFIGSLTGISFGSFIGAVVKGNENTKTGVLIGVTMIGSFLSGMMFGEMKYIVQTNAPILSYLNPINLLGDAFYSLYIYDTYNRYYTNIAGLLVFTIIFSISTYLIIRRRKYASI
ncbi:ABC transporter permease [Alkalibacter mobilis]|uniref:ABC transporter permease n=1 Tax=Alkalibacter mobilis TaxID=2787712 RepID=UPI0018A00D23|nr:ABC transporter permease [Alkalibacter mobilis]MBF7097495.1 ABC transporter permease [Alkalibacter mobilis]